MVHACCDAVALAIRNRVTNDRGVQPPHCIPPPTTDPSTSPRDGDTCGSLQGELIAHLDELAAQIRGTLIEDTDEQPAGRQVCNCGIQNGTTRHASIAAIRIVRRSIQTTSNWRASWMEVEQDGSTTTSSPPAARPCTPEGEPSPKYRTDLSSSRITTPPSCTGLAPARRCEHGFDDTHKE